MILLIGGEKGGTGKTTIATNLAALRALAGFDVLLVDTDQQGSASYWAATRDDAMIRPRVASIQKFGKGVVGELRDLADRYQEIIIDAGGRDSVELRSAMVVAEKVVIPLQASQFDVWTLERMAELVDQAEGLNPQLEASVVINRASPNPVVGETNDARTYLEDFEHISLLSTVIRDRIAYRRAAAEGMAVNEMPKCDRKASAEIQLLYAEVFGDDWSEEDTKTNG